MPLLLGVGCSSEKANNGITQQSTTAAVTEKSTTNRKEKAKNKTSKEEKSNALATLNLKETTVSRVVDGDTVELSDGSKVRFVGVNTPESTTTTEPYGKESSNYTKSQLTGKTVYLEKDVSQTDKYGRLLRYVWLSTPKEINDSEIRTKMFNAILVQNGYAEVSTYPPDVKYQEHFTKYNSESRNTSKGLWAINHNGTTKGDVSGNSTTSTIPNHSNPNSTNSNISSGHGLIKGNISSSVEKIYHVPGGKFYDKTIPEQWFNTDEEAQAAGYRKSKL
jgi:micrococcal nuclease